MNGMDRSQFEALVELADAYLRDALDDAGFARLESMLRDDPAAAGAMAQYLAQVGMMREVLAEQTRPDRAAADPELRAYFSILHELEPHGPVDTVDLTDELSRREHPQPVGPELHLVAEEARYRPLVIPWSVFWGGIAAAVLLAVWVFTLLPGDRPGPTGLAGSPEQVDAEDKDLVVATLTATHEARWGSGDLRVGETLEAGQKLMLTRGYAQITTTSGASALLQAPCSVEVLEGGNALRLLQGRLVGRVDLPSAKGFTVYGDNAQVTDHGTEFGVEVEDGRTRVLVFEGSVELAESMQDAPTTNTPQNRRVVRLEAGWSSSVSPQGELADQAVAVLPADRLSFVHSIQDAADVKARARRAVLASGPVAYWPFDDLDYRSTRSVIAPDRQVLEVSGRVALEQGPFGAALRFTANPAGTDYLRSLQPIEALTDSRTYTISVWCRLDRRHDGRIVTLYALDRSQQEAHRFAAGLQSTIEDKYVNGKPIPSDALRFTHRDPPGTDIRTGSNLFSEGFVPGPWVHFVAVKHADRVELYRDGQVVSQTAEPGRIQGSPYVLLGVSPAVFELQGRSDMYQPFAGLIDELSLYDRALSADEVAGLYEPSRALLRADQP